MIGRWLGQDVPAVGISIGFERIMDLVAPNQSGQGLVLVVDIDEPGAIAKALQLQAEGIASGRKVRIEQKPKKLNLLLDTLREQGLTEWASVSAQTANFAALEIRSIG